MLILSVHPAATVRDVRIRLIIYMVGDIGLGTQRGLLDLNDQRQLIAHSLKTQAFEKSKKNFDFFDFSIKNLCVQDPIVEKLELNRFSTKQVAAQAKHR